MENTETEKQAENGGAETKRDAPRNAMDMMCELATLAGKLGWYIDEDHDITFKRRMTSITLTLSMK